MIYHKLHWGIDTSEEGDFIVTFGIVDGKVKVLSQKRVGEPKKDIAQGYAFKIFKQTPQSAIEENEPKDADNECIQ